MIQIGDIVKPSAMNLESLDSYPTRYVITEISAYNIRGLWKDDDGWHVNEIFYDFSCGEMDDFSYYYDVIGHLTETELEKKIASAQNDRK